MLKKIILLLLISLCFQANLFSMDEKEQSIEFVDINSLKMCTRCRNDSFLSILGGTKCRNCNQIYFDLRFKGTNSKESEEDENIPSYSTNTKFAKPSLTKKVELNIFRLIKFLVPIATICLAYKYRNQIKKFLVRK